MQAEIFTLSTIERKFIYFQNEKQNIKNKFIFKVPSVSNQFSDAEIINPDERMRKQCYNLGERQLKTKQIAIVILAGGYGCRAEQQPSKQFKQIRLGQSATTLFQNTMNTVIGQVNKNINWKACIYVICNKMNHAYVLEYVTKYKEENGNGLPIYICYQHEEDVLDCMGLQSIYCSKEDNNKLKAPAGIGALKKARIIYEKEQIFTLQSHILTISQSKLVYCVGTSNLQQSGIDLELIGFISTNKLDCVYKVGLHEIQKDNLSFVCTAHKEGSQDTSLSVLQYKTIQELTNTQEINRFPAWMDNFVFDPSIWKKRFPKKPNQIIYQFHNRTLKNSHDMQLQCIIPQLTISYAFLRDKQKCKGYYSRRPGFFIKTKEDFQRIQSYSTNISPLKSKRES